jgi:hypothetical protein
MKPSEATAAARLVERLLADATLRARFRQDPASVSREAGIDSVADELEYLCSRYRRPFVIFRDPLFTHDRARVLALCEQIRARRLELRFARLVPRQDTRIVLCDDGDGLVEPRRHAAVRGESIERRDIHALQRGEEDHQEDRAEREHRDGGGVARPQRARCVYVAPMQAIVSERLEETVRVAPSPKSTSPLGSSTPQEKIPRGRCNLKLRPTSRTPFANSAEASVSPGWPLKRRPLNSKDRDCDRSSRWPKGGARRFDVMGAADHSSHIRTRLGGSGYCARD